MTDACFPIEDLGEIAAAGPNDPRHRHAQECARCHALLAALREFKEPTRLPEGLNLEDADRRLGSFLARQTGAEGQRGDNARAPIHGRVWTRLSTWLRGPVWRPALALAASAAAVLIVVNVLDLGDGRTHRIVPRQDGSSAEQLLLSAPEDLGNDRVRLAWSAVDGAETYRVTFYDTDLNELSTVDAGGSTSLELDVSTLPTHREETLWLVVALKGGDELRRSRPRSLLSP